MKMSVVNILRGFRGGVGRQLNRTDFASECSAELKAIVDRAEEFTGENTVDILYMLALSGFLWGKLPADIQSALMIAITTKMNAFEVKQAIKILAALAMLEMPGEQCDFFNFSCFGTKYVLEGLDESVLHQIFIARKLLKYPFSEDILSLLNSPPQVPALSTLQKRVQSELKDFKFQSVYYEPAARCHLHFPYQLQGHTRLVLLVNEEENFFASSSTGLSPSEPMPNRHMQLTYRFLQEAGWRIISISWRELEGRSNMKDYLERKLTAIPPPLPQRPQKANLTTGHESFGFPAVPLSTHASSSSSSSSSSRPSLNSSASAVAVNGLVRPQSAKTQRPGCFVPVEFDAKRSAARPPAQMGTQPPLALPPKAELGRSWAAKAAMFGSSSPSQPSGGSRLQRSSSFSGGFEEHKKPQAPLTGADFPVLSQSQPSARPPTQPRQISYVDAASAGRPRSSSVTGSFESYRRR